MLFSNYRLSNDSTKINKIFQKNKEIINKKSKYIFYKKSDMEIVY